METYNGEFRDGAPCWIRTSGLLLRRQLLYPAELKAHRKRSAAYCCFSGAGDGNRTHVTSLEGWNSTIELHPHDIQQKTLYHTEGSLSIAEGKKSHFAQKRPSFLSIIAQPRSAKIPCKKIAKAIDKPGEACYHISVTTVLLSLIHRYDPKIGQKLLQMTKYCCAALPVIFSQKLQINCKIY